MKCFVFILSLLAGVSYTATDDGSYSAPAGYLDCKGHDTLVNACKEQHLEYLGRTDIASDLKDVPKLGDLDYLLEKNRLTKMCGSNTGDAVDLMKYFECVFNNLTDCLKRQNRTKINMPDGGRISKGVYDLCLQKDNINMCIDGVTTELKSCYEKTANENEQCSRHNARVECTETHAAKCDGGKYLIDFVKAGRLQLCDTGAGNRNTVAICFLLLAVFTSFLAARV